ncbi:hypothetical protein EHW99_0402 [Erwinia amylovora]|nr:hypothetical protein EHX00_0402 [Erwinia amylovora]QJQ56807.1 hypothetical protein EHW99_0402 [Erwinia amylovora]QJQ60506.1 hypothetical protein EHW98_0402 [Erwinia amylovora]QJQ64308.1 hypothetical protein EHW96_0402 [Erwinia amylovora]QJQ68007.1 hypothetical protein EGZ89_0402 [Erwinia amylovora]
MDAGRDAVSQIASASFSSPFWLLTTVFTYFLGREIKFPEGITDNNFIQK